MTVFIVGRVVIYVIGLATGLFCGYMIFGEDRVGDTDDYDDLFLVNKMNQKSMNHGASVVDMDDPLNIDLGN